MSAPIKPPASFEVFSVGRYADKQTVWASRALAEKHCADLNGRLSPAEMDEWTVVPVTVWRDADAFEKGET